MKKLCFLILVLLIGANTNAQLIFNHFNDFNSALPSNTVRSIAVETNSTGWVGTDNGLVYLDLSNNMTVYNTSNSGIPSNSVRSIFVDANNKKWIGTFTGGLAVYNDTNWTVYNTSNSMLPDDFVRSTAQESNGIIWVGTTGGLVKIDDTTWTVYNQFNSDLESSNIASIYIDANNTKFIGTINGGLTILTDTSFTTYTLTNSGLPDNTILGIDEDQNGTIWMATPAGGLIGYIGTINWVVQNTLNSTIESNNLNDLVIGPLNRIWIGSQNKGLLTKAGNVFGFYLLTSFFVNDDNVTCIDYSNDNFIWMGTSADGLVKATPDMFLSVNAIDLGNISIYPNPFVSEVYIESNKINWKSYSLYKIDGSEIFYNCKLENNKIILSENLTTGSYLLQLHNGNKLSLQKLIIKSGN